ncbi:maleylacetate reductase [Bacillus sp. B15-48]|uniref:maleylacetate reductase n=1 Tax=Bacillus sp. B15-48 TaxID=1548601 RepID=UPI00193EFB4A|nr:maleylacetate reductase [Bacillus sp. B15-48]MBM4763584.1 iron-containing alcohol dehydrogenase [Bacillus sp. B15-48]
MKTFIYESQPSRTVFGEGTINEINKEVQLLGMQNALVISTPGKNGMELAIKVASLLGEVCQSVYPKAIQHVPIETVTEAIEYVKMNRIDGLIAIGGGSPIGLAKAIALETKLPILAVPTTYAGSEMTPVWGITENGVKKTGTNPGVKPKTIIYDPALTTTIPAMLSVTSGVNSIAHCVEGLYSETANPITSLLAEEGIKSFVKSLPKIVENPSDLSARSDAFYGAWLGGTVLGTVGMALHHKLCHTLGGSFKLPHAETHTVVLPYAIAYNAEYTPDAIAALSRALNSDRQDVAGTLFDLIQSLGGPVSLESIGFKQEDIEKAADLTTKNSYYNPRPVEQEAIIDLLKNAYYGRRPEPIKNRG